VGPASEIERFLREIGELLVEEDFVAVSDRFAPWLDDLGETHLQTAIAEQIEQTREDAGDDIELGSPSTCEIDDSAFAWEDLEDEVEALPVGLTEDRFRQWSCISVQTANLDGDVWVLYDFWCAIAATDGQLAIGYFEVMAPD